MYLRPVVCILLVLCTLMWTTNYMSIGDSITPVLSAQTDLSTERDHMNFLKRITPFYVNLTVDHRLSQLEDAVFDEHTGEPVVYLRSFDEPSPVSVPKSWCLPSIQQTGPVTYRNKIIKKRRFPTFSLKSVLDGCFKEIDPNALNRNKLRHSLRLLRNAFKDVKIPLIMTFGSVLGSLRYHQRMFYDVDYDFFVDEQDTKSAVGILAGLSGNMSNEMRFIDARPSYSPLKFGFLCGRVPAWRQLDKRCVEKNESYVECSSKESAARLISPCQYYGDFYWMKKDEQGNIRADTVDTIFAQADVLDPHYRPLDGTLFRSIENFYQYTEGIYGSPGSVCVPKSGRLANIGARPQLFEQNVFYCSYFGVPCVHIDQTHPRFYTIIDGTTRIELGLRWLKSDECSVHSLFVKFK